MKKIEIKKTVKNYIEGQLATEYSEIIDKKNIYLDLKKEFKNFRYCRDFSLKSVELKAGKRCISMLFERNNNRVNNLLIEGHRYTLKTIQDGFFNWSLIFMNFVESDEKKLNKLYVIKFAGGFSSSFYAENDEDAIKERDNYLNRNEAKIFERERLVATIPPRKGLQYYIARKTWKDKDLTSPRGICWSADGKTFEEMEVKNEDN